MADAWIFQKIEQVRDLGEAKASWYVGWYEPEGKHKKKSFGPASAASGPPRSSAARSKAS
jgi:hypothetical protein